MSETSILKFDAVNVPTPYESTEKREDKYVQYGTNNLYPNFLLKLYNESPIHSSIVNSKATYIVGDGLKVNETPLNLKVNSADKIDEFVNKIVKDYILFNYFAVEVVYNVFNVPIEFHFVPAHKVRSNKSKTKFWVNEDWKYGSRPIIYDRYKPHSKDSKSKLFFFDGYNPSENNVYSTPEYSGAIKAIQNDIEIRNFNLNNIRNNFSVSTIITFFRGSNVSEDIKKETLKKLKDSYTGSEGNKLIIDFQDPNNPSADVKNISPNDWDKAYQEVSKSVANDIYIGHQVTSPMLFGVKTEGQLGGSTELETAYEIFKNTYIRNRRNELQEALNLLFAEFEAINGQVEFVDKQLFSARISEDLKEKIYTINELRKEAGLPPLPYGDKLLGETSEPQPTQFSKQDEDEYFHLSEEDFEKIKDLGTIQEEFEFIGEGEVIESKEDFKRIELEFDTQQEISDYLMKNDLSGMSINEIKAVLRKDLSLNITKAGLTNIFKDLTAAGVFNISIDGDIVKVSKPNTNKKIETMYSYVVRAGLGEPIIETTRPFCRRLIENNRLYTREEIQTMSSIFGYDMFTLCGGFYRNPKTGVTTRYCRHQFKQRIVVRKK